MWGNTYVLEMRTQMESGLLDHDNYKGSTYSRTGSYRDLRHFEFPALLIFVQRLQHSLGATAREDLGAALTTFRECKRG